MPNLCIRFNDHDIIKKKASKYSRYLNLYTTMEEPSVFNVKENRMGDFYHNNGIYDFESGSKFNSYNFSTSKFTIYFWLKFKPEFCNSDGSIVPNKAYIGMEDGNIYTCEIPNDTEAHHYCLERDGNKTIYFFIDGKLKLMEYTNADFNMDSNSYIYIGNPIKHCFGNECYADDIYIYKGETLFDTNGFDPPTEYLYIPDIEYYDLYQHEIDLYGVKFE